ncbi:MAG: hypothetical protein WBM90_06355 [Acidimicrobiia bacterium]
MSTKSRTLLIIATVAVGVSLVSRFVATPLVIDVGDFATGFGVALLVGVLIITRGRRVPPV